MQCLFPNPRNNYIIDWDISIYLLEAILNYLNSLFLKLLTFDFNWCANLSIHFPDVISVIYILFLALCVIVLKLTLKYL